MGWSYDAPPHEAWSDAPPDSITKHTKSTIYYRFMLISFFCSENFIHSQTLHEHASLYHLPIHIFGLSFYAHFDGFFGVGAWEHLRRLEH
jgi:hypothetical protein